MLSPAGFTVTALHAYHLDFGLTAGQVQKWQAVRAAQAASDAEFTPPPTASDGEVEPVTISSSDGAVAVGEVRVRW